MKKVLFICTFGDFLVSFEQSNISIYQSLGYEVHCAANFDDKIFNKNKDILINKGILIHNIPFKRKPWNLSVIKNYFLLKKLVKKYKFDVLDIHNAVCGVIGRLVGKKCNVKKIVYTPHSFFFFK